MAILSPILSALAAAVFLWHAPAPPTTGVTPRALFASHHGWAGPRIGIAFPPVSRRDHVAFTVSALRDLAIRDIRIAENWKRRGITPTAEDFEPLRRKIGTLRRAGLRIMLTVQTDGPPEVCGPSNKFGCAFRPDAPFEAYLTQLLAAVGDRIDAIQFGNEWDHQFAGSIAEYVALHDRFARTVRAHRPDLTLVLGGITNRAPYAHAVCSRAQSFDLPGSHDTSAEQSFCAQSEKNDFARQAVRTVAAQADYDVFDVHLYDAPGLWETAVGWVARLAQGKPIWITEFGGPHPALEPRDPAYHARQLARYMATVERLPVDRAYYFKLTDDDTSYHSRSGLYDQQGRAKPALGVFRHHLGLD
ncbi:MAG: glycosyl hydrolase [Pseudomonadota bacterium]